MGGATVLMACDLSLPKNVIGVLADCGYDNQKEVIKKVNPSQMVVKIVHDELVELLGGEKKPLNMTGNPSVLMLVGLQGSGKTTTIGKISNLLRKKHAKKPLLVACDVYRPAAIDQLKQIGKQLNIEVYEEGKKDPVEIVNNAIKYAKENKFDYVLIDTAGRLHIDEPLMEEFINRGYIKNVEL